MTQWAENIAAAWDQTTDQDREMGAIAYQVYQATLRGLADFYGLGMVPVVEAFVALSPNNDYHGNLRSLASVLDGWCRGLRCEQVTVTTYNACRDRAWSYIAGDVSFLDTVGGRKITSFRDNILYLEKSKRVTCDGHMVCIGEGRDMTMSAANLALRSGPVYDEVERAVLKLRNHSKGGAPGVQAALWTWRKRVKGIRYSSQLNLFDEGTLWDRVLKPGEISPYPHMLG